MFCPHLLRVCSSANDLNFTHRGASLGSLSFNYISYGAEVEVSVNDTNRADYIAVFPLSGYALVTNRNRKYDLEAGSVMVLDPSDPFKFEMQTEHSHLAVGIPRQKLSAYLSEFSDDFNANRFAYQNRPYLPHEVGTGLFSFMNYICSEIDRPGSMTQQSVVSNSIEQTFLALFNTALTKPQNPQFRYPKIASCTGQYVEKAERFMEENLTEDVTADDIINIVGIPARTLYNAYKKHYNFGPMTWLKIRRLRQARLDLLDEEQVDTSVTEIALRYQQAHVGRFSRAYFNEFGEHPSETRKQLRNN